MRCKGIENTGVYVECLPLFWIKNAIPRPKTILNFYHWGHWSAICCSDRSNIMLGEQTGWLLTHYYRHSWEIGWAPGNWKNWSLLHKFRSVLTCGLTANMGRNLIFIYIIIYMNCSFELKFRFSNLVLSFYYNNCLPHINLLILVLVQFVTSFKAPDPTAERF